MMTALKAFVAEELERYRAHRREGRRAEAWVALERAHVLSQPDAWLHTRVHLSMLGYGLALGDWGEVRGQVVRIAVAGVGSWTGRAPIGNTGRSHVPILQPMPVPPDLAARLDQVSTPPAGGSGRPRP